MFGSSLPDHDGDVIAFFCAWQQCQGHGSESSFSLNTSESYLLIFEANQTMPFFLAATFLCLFGGSHSMSRPSHSSLSTIMSTISPFTSFSAPYRRMSSDSRSPSDA